MDLTMCGLLVGTAEEMARLYATHRDWTTVEERWFDERRDGRSTRDSSRKLYRVLSSRFKTADGSLPAISRLPAIFDRCATDRDRAQVLYFYLIDDDPLVQYAVHRYVGRLRRTGADGLDFDQEVVDDVLSAFHYADGSGFDYADSTTRRWGEGLRSVMRDVGVLEDRRTFRGAPPTVGTVPLLVASGYSWERGGDDWLSRPTGWLYLFQPEEYWESLADRLAEHPAWEATGMHGDLRLRPRDDTYGWADPTEGET